MKTFNLPKLQTLYQLADDWKFEIEADFFNSPLISAAFGECIGSLHYNGEEGKVILPKGTVIQFVSFGDDKLVLNVFLASKNDNGVPWCFWINPSELDYLKVEDNDD